MEILDFLYGAPLGYEREQRSCVNKEDFWDWFMNQSQKSLPENPHQGDHEAGDDQKGNVGCSVPVIPSDQSPPVV
jgi:hypothetical protein